MSIKEYGLNDKKVSPFLKAWITQPDKENKISTCVVGLIGPGTSRSLQANWNSPFEQTNVGGMFEKGAGIAQIASGGMTSITTLSSTQIWDGNRPNVFNLNLIFYALKDAKKEVHLALKELEKMMGPDIKAGDDSKEGLSKLTELFKSAIPGGNIPRPIVLNIGRRMMIPNCVIESMAIPLDKEKTKDGYLVRAEVNLSIATKVMLNRDNIGASFG
ncbi:MAG: hypothetical protein NTV58_15060 [Deltaproteobacteria bacterium]|nr:hypothetical protein [Deltaproteobacteria bacterium]